MGEERVEEESSRRDTSNLATITPELDVIINQEKNKTVKFNVFSLCEFLDYIVM